MRKNYKKIICALLCVSCLFAIVFPVSAETITYDITANTDTLSRKATKSSSAYENKAYVTATWFSAKGSFQCMSVCYSKPSIVSQDMYVFGDGGYTYEDADAKDEGFYYSSAPGGVYYYMSASSVTNGLNMRGRYTP